MYNVISSRQKPVNVEMTVPLDGTDGSGPKSDSGKEIGVGNANLGAQCPNHSLAFEKGDSTVGTLTITATAVGKTTPEPVFESDGVTPLIIDLADANEPKTRSISNKAIKSFSVEAAGMDGATDYKMIISSGD